LSKKYFYVHIPKTAGTSFRVAAQNSFGKKNTLFDYGNESNVTSSIIKESMYIQKDENLLIEQFNKHNKLILSGHVPVTKYYHLFKKFNIITFVRNPIDQVVSHYKHYCRDLQYKEDFPSFIKDERFKNLQTRMLTSNPLETIGFIGLTEEYELSIKLINNIYNLKLKILNKNISPNEFSDKAELSEDILQLILDENKDDMLLYETIKSDFYKKVEKYNNAKDRGFLNFLRNLKLYKGNK